MATQYFPIKLPAGVFTTDASYSMKGRWIKSNLVRWMQGSLRPVGGWQAIGASNLTGTPRAILAWQTNAGQPLIAVGTEDHLYSHDGSLANDITPSDLAAGRGTATPGLGFGSGNYGADDYGAARVDNGGLVLGATVWDLGTYGEDLIALSPADGRIFRWSPSVGGDAAVIDQSAPIDNAGVLVTDERFVVALGADGDPRRVTWCSQEDPSTWTATKTNTAGSMQLETDGHILSAARLPGEALIFTTADVHSLRYVGPPFIYGRARLGRNCGIIARNAHAEAEGFCVWMTPDSFMLYDGQLRALPCAVWPDIFDNINLQQASKIVAGTNAAFGEIWFFYPSLGSPENNLYAIWNYRENWWAVGEMSRTAWTDRGVWETPLATGADKKIYQHESGWSYPGASAAVFVESAPFDIGNGDRVLQVNQILPDTDVAGRGALTYTFKLRFTPQGAEHVAGPYRSARGDGYIDTRFSGRQAALRVVSDGPRPFELGIIRLAAHEVGRR